MRLGFEKYNSDFSLAPGLIIIIISLSLIQQKPRPNIDKPLSFHTTQFDPWDKGCYYFTHSTHKKLSWFGASFSLPRYTIVTSWRFLMTETSLIIINPPPGDLRIRRPVFLLLILIIKPTCRAGARLRTSCPRLRLDWDLIECNLWAVRRLRGARVEDLTCLRTQLF